MTTRRYMRSAMILTVVAACGSTKTEQAGNVIASGTPIAPAPAATASLTAEDKKLYRDIARSSWTYLDKYYQPATGLVNASPDWSNTTLWDVGGQLIAYHAAKELGFLSPAEFDKRMTKTLATLERVPLFRDLAFNKQYSTATGAIARERIGWSATDLGRFLIGLKIVATRDPQFAAQAERIAHRNSFANIVKGGYLQGEIIGSNGKPWAYQEGRIGYEQYVANGFAQWGADVRAALDLKKNGKPVEVLGVPLLADQRFQDRLLSEPFVLYGLELGLDGAMKELAENVLRAQEARFKSTGQVTVASEDAVGVPPEYFYYYCVYCSGKPFVIDVSNPGKEQDSPRWVSTKAAFGWNALMPDEYTKTAVDYVAAAYDPKLGWASGVYEGSKRSTKTFDINTASVMMEIAFYRLRGNKPLMAEATVQP